MQPPVWGRLPWAGEAAELIAASSTASSLQNVGRSTAWREARKPRFIGSRRLAANFHRRVTPVAGGCRQRGGYMGDGEHAARKLLYFAELDT
jgi:hypothetical protein